MKALRLFGVPGAALIGALVIPLVASGPVGAAITTTTQVTTASGSEKFAVANVAPKIWVAKGLTQLDGSALTANTVTPYSWYEFEILAEDDNTLWNSRIVLCFHNTSHAVSYAGGSFAGTSGTPLNAFPDCLTGGAAAGEFDYSNQAGIDAANPAGATADASTTSQGESWRKARWVLKAKPDAGLAYGVDPEASAIDNTTTNNGTWRLAGDLTGSEPAGASDVACDHATRTIGGVSTKTRWDSTLLHLKCSVRIGTLARASAGSADWDLFAAILDSGNEPTSSYADTSYLNQVESGSMIAYCSGLAAADGIPGGASVDVEGNFDSSQTCDNASYDAPSMFKVGTNLSIGSVEGKDFGTFKPLTQTVGATSSSTGTDPNPAPVTAANTTASCSRDTGDGTTSCVYTAHKVDDLVANTDTWKFQAKTTASDGSASCNTSGNTKIAPVLGYSSGTSYTCWYATTNPVSTAGVDTARNQNQTYAVALYEPAANTSASEWSATTLQANEFAFRCVAYPRDTGDASTLTRAINPPAITDGWSSPYVTKSLTDIPLYEYASGTNHVVNTIAGGSNTPATRVAGFDGMGSDNTSGDTTRIWRRLDTAATSYEAYLQCRLDTSYVKPGTYTGTVYLAITSA